MEIEKIDCNYQFYSSLLEVKINRKTAIASPRLLEMFSQDLKLVIYSLFNYL